MTEIAEYTLNSTLWSVAGLAAGYLLGRTEREIHAIYKKVVEEDDGQI